MRFGHAVGGQGDRRKPAHPARARPARSGLVARALRARAAGGLSAEHLPGLDDRALLIMTGGTTGTPKGVDHRHRNLLASVLLHCTVWPVGFGSETLLNVAPLFHIWGLGYAVLVSVFARGRFVLVPRFDPEAVLAAIGEHRVTIFGGGPAPIYAGLVGSDAAARADFSSLKYCLSGGAPCPESLHRRWLALTGCPILEGWGMSEGAPLCINPAAGVRKLLSVGPPVPETAIDIVDIDSGTTVLPVGECGEVRVRGPQLMSAYRNNPAETAVALRDGWLYTGDIGYVDEDGYLFLVDRKKDMVIVGGYNVYPREVDELLCLHPDIREASAVGLADERLGEVLVAFVAPLAGQRLSGRSLPRVLPRQSRQVQAAGENTLSRCAATYGGEQDRQGRAQATGCRFDPRGAFIRVGGGA